jgi:hypothetical protein
MRSGAYSHPAVQQALRNHYFDSFGVPDSMSLPKPNPVELPWYEAYARWCGGAVSRSIPDPDPGTERPRGTILLWVCCVKLS